VSGDEPPTLTLLLHGKVPMRHLELTLDSVIGQTESGFVLFASRQDVGEAGARMMAEYDDARLMVLEDFAACLAGLRGRFVMPLRAGDLLAPTCVAALAGALDRTSHAMVAVCDTGFFDGAALYPADPMPGGEQALAAGLRAGDMAGPSALMFRARNFPRAGCDLDDPGSLCRSVLDEGMAVAVPDRLAIRRVAGRAAPPAALPRVPARLFGRTYSPADIDAERPPTLYVVVDTEAEFDWGRPFATDLTEVSAMAGIASAQSIFDRYGLRPLYVVDYPVASQPDGIAAIRPIADRGACAIGAHLHPWANPPFGEDTTRRLSFPGNLPLEVEAAKLDSLLEAIARNFMTAPPFYKAGRYGLGPNTAALIASRGARVDFSLLPQTDLRSQDGPDFSAIEPIPYCVENLGLLALPMTRAHVGRLAQRRALTRWLAGRTAKALHMPGMFARTGLAERLTLTPEGVPAALQIRLIQALLAQGNRMFVLHFHSPSLVAGHTPYVRTESDRTALLGHIDAVCRWFFAELGGLPGRPWDLLTRGERGKGLCPLTPSKASL
jgi:hypothetical protein